MVMKAPLERGLLPLLLLSFRQLSIFSRNDLLLHVAVESIVRRRGLAHHGLGEVEHMQHVILVLIVLIVFPFDRASAPAVGELSMVISLLGRKEGSLCAPVLFRHDADRVGVDIGDGLHALHFRVV